MEVAANAVRANEHQRMDRVARSLHHVGGSKFDALGARGRRYFFAQLFFGFRPLAIERRDQIAARTHWPVWLLPGCAASVSDDV